MIIGEKFLWLHLGKAAGTTTRHMFHTLRGMVDNTIEMNEKGFNGHDNIDKRTNFYDEPFKYDEEYLYGLDKIINIRRLPSYILSRCEHAFKSHGVKYTKDHMLNGLTEGSYSAIYNADNVLMKYIEKKEPDHFIRSEYVNEDFIRIMGNYYNLTNKVMSRLINSEDNVNLDYNKSLSYHFTDSELKRIYDICPIWSSYEEKIYGDLLI